MRISKSGLAIALALLAAAAPAQLLQPVIGAVGQVGREVGQVAGDLVQRGGTVLERLAHERSLRLSDRVRRAPADLEFDLGGNAAIRGELILIDPDPASLNAIVAAGYAVKEDARVDGIDLRTVRLDIPAGMSLRAAQKQVAKIAPGAAIQSNPVYEPMGMAVAAGRSGAQRPSETGPAGAIGLIDGGIASHAALPQDIVQRGFATGAPFPDAHATAIASIMVGKGEVRGVAPGAHLFAADIFGRDPRGGSALAIAQAMGWLIRSHVAVINLSLSGPDNPLLARAVAAADARGVLLVAAVGNDGAAAPPAFPASYPQVIAVTGVDGKGRVLIEAGRAAHLDFAAPGADMVAARPGGGVGDVRGTSFAAPFVAARIASLTEAPGRISRGQMIDLLGKSLARPPQGYAVKLYGRGIICYDCATRKN